jgi:hypothetical protein
MTPGEHATHTVVKFPALNGGQHESKQESKPDAVAPWDTPLGANNLLRKIVLRPAEWEGVRVPPRRWFAQNRIPMREVTGLGGDAARSAFANKRARAFFPSLAASAMLSKKTDELSSGPHRPAR